MLRSSAGRWRAVDQRTTQMAAGVCCRAGFGLANLSIFDACTLAALAGSLRGLTATHSFLFLDVDPRRDLGDQPTVVLPDSTRPVVKRQQDAAAVGNVTRLG